MQHCDPDVLALVALGERPGAADAEHLLECEQCRVDVEDLRQVVSAVRVEVPPGPPVPPPARVWSGIAATTGVRSTPRDEFLHGSTLDAPAPAVARQDGTDELNTRRERRRFGSRVVVGIAAAALVLGAAGGVLGSRLLDRSTPVPASDHQVVAVVALTNLQPHVTQASGSASVVRTASGKRLVLDVSELKPVPGHFYEVWLIDSSIRKMVGLGILDGTTGQFVIPEGVDVSAYPIVDVSVQQPGNPKHSGDSVLRGVLRT